MHHLIYRMLSADRKMVRMYEGNGRSEEENEKVKAEHKTALSLLERALTDAGLEACGYQVSYWLDSKWTPWADIPDSVFRDGKPTSEVRYRKVYAAEKQREQS